MSRILYACNFLRNLRFILILLPFLISKYETNGNKINCGLRKTKMVKNSVVTAWNRKGPCKKRLYVRSMITDS